MKQLTALPDFTTPFHLYELAAWMDGGSVTLYLLDADGAKFSVEFCQKLTLKKGPFTNTPGSFLLNGQEIAIRSDDEKQLLKALRGMSIGHLTLLEQELVQGCITFVESEDYLHIAAAMGRFPNS